MYIALVTDGISPYVVGGMQRHSFHLARHLLKLGVRLFLVHAVDSDEVIPSEQTVMSLLGGNSKNLKVVGLHFPKKGRLPGHYLRESYAYSTEVEKALESELSSLDFIYAKGFCAWSMLEKKKKGVHFAPIGVKFHGYEMFQLTKSLRGKLEQFMLKPPVVFNNREANLVFSYGGEITAIIEKIGVNKDRIIEIGSGVDASWILPHIKRQNGKRKFCFVGRNERRKGVLELSQCSDIIDSFDCEMHWVGPIPEDRRIKSTRHIYHGEITNVESLQSILDECQILVVPSLAEGMPNVILEGMARGLAIIASKVGAVPMMISERNGILVEPGNLGSLKEAMKRLAGMSTSSLNEMREASLETVRTNFEWSGIAQKTLSAIKKATHTTRKEHEIDG
jgi:glycosyltransferase involved in cell wall biosynthesis